MSTSPTLWYDNLGATYFSVNPVLDARTKHVESDYHFVRERMAAKTLQVSFVSSKYQIADILTKLLANLQFLQLRSSLTFVRCHLNRGAVKEKTSTATALSQDRENEFTKTQRIESFCN